MIMVPGSSIKCVVYQARANKEKNEVETKKEKRDITMVF